MADEDHKFARAALEAAAEGFGLASPNPLVGTVVVKDGEVVGRGIHRYADRKHAEVVALEEAGELARGATVYVNLEPCSHFGRTPPCADALVEAGVARVVASIEDPAPWVNGGGFDRLRAAGIEVTVGVEREAAERLNEQYLTSVTRNRPFVLVKCATTLDGRVATRTGASKWITGEASREASQELRRLYDAILVGVATVAVDDPDLTYRGALPKRVPLVRCVVDPSLRIPLESRIVRGSSAAPVVVYAREDADATREQALRERGVEVVRLGAVDGRLDLTALLADLAARKVLGLVVEGGPETAARFVEARLVDKATFFVAPAIMGGRDSRGAVGGDGPDSLDRMLRLVRIETRMLGEDVEITGYAAGARFDAVELDERG
jgi:diaminohydroxyphosphoribosylaminopyrimidine deaminase/5-amino-6-(5-phosphoribosylamino)uracil reductase